MAVEAQQKKLAQAFYSVTHNPDFQRVLLSEELLRDSMALLDSDSAEVIRLVLTGFHALTTRKNSDHVRVVARLPGFALRLIAINDNDECTAEAKKLASDILANFEALANGNPRKGSRGSRKRDTSSATPGNANKNGTSADGTALSTAAAASLSTPGAKPRAQPANQTKFEGKFKVANLNCEKDENRLVRGLMLKQRELGIISVHIPPSSSEVHLLTRSNDSTFSARLMTVLSALGYPLIDIVGEGVDENQVSSVSVDGNGVALSTSLIGGVTATSSGTSGTSLTDRELSIPSVPSIPDISTPLQQRRPSMTALAMPLSATGSVVSCGSVTSGTSASGSSTSMSSLYTPMKKPLAAATPVKAAGGQPVYPTFNKVGNTPDPRKGAMTLYTAGFNATMTTAASQARARRQQQSAQATAARAGLMSGVVGYFF